MSLNQNLNKFSKIKLGVLGKKRLARLSFYFTDTPALPPYITCIFRIYFTFQLLLLFFLFLFLFACREFISGPRLFGILHLAPPSLPLPPRLHCRKTWTRTGQEAMQSWQNPLSQPKVVKQPQIKIHELMHISYITADCFGLACL